MSVRLVREALHKRRDLPRGGRFSCRADLRGVLRPYQVVTVARASLEAGICLVDAARQHAPSWTGQLPTRLNQCEGRR